MIKDLFIKNIRDFSSPICIPQNDPYKNLGFFMKPPSSTQSSQGQFSKPPNTRVKQGNESQGKASSQVNVIKCTTQPVRIHSCISRSESSSVCRWSIVCYLMHEKLAQFILHPRLSAFLWNRWRRWRRTRWCWSRHDLWFEPHIRKHLTDTFFDLGIKVSIACQFQETLISLRIKDDIFRSLLWTTFSTYL